ncbi:MAG: hypothetical protein LBN43_06925 [Oscillospiraceae bacterium]|jgi:hypothetical protein|nr:hypothetical protein [Oscillospiraceae bacterium]
MYILERYVFQGTEKCPQYKWKQFVMFELPEPLERVRANQRTPGDWRITKTAFDTLKITNKRRKLL